MSSSIRLTSEQCWTISSYLHTDAACFKDFADLANQDPRLVTQFKKQQDEARALADLFTQADSAILKQESEE